MVVFSYLMFPDIYQTVDLFDGPQLLPACPCDKRMERGWVDNRQRKNKTPEEKHVPLPVFPAQIPR
jgi:hypothetical protein